MSFWTENYSSEGVNNPKRNFRFTVQFTNMDNLTGYEGSVLFYAKTADKPSFTLGETSHNFLNHTFKFPGRVTWNDITIAMVDPGPNTGADDGGGVGAALTKLLSASGYGIPESATADYTTISKTKAVSGLGDVIITQIDSDGASLESWTLHNAFVSDVQYGTLDYSSDDLTEYSITLRYDWAICTAGSEEISYTGEPLSQ